MFDWAILALLLLFSFICRLPGNVVITALLSQWRGALLNPSQFSPVLILGGDRSEKVDVFHFLSAP